MKKIISISVALVALLTVFAVAITASVHISSSSAFLRQSEEEIREYILELTTVGISMEEARIVIEERFQIEEWGYGLGSGRTFIDYRNGVVRRYAPGIDPYHPPDIGVKAISVQLGSYRRSGRLFGFTHVFVGWGFDENSELIDVHVSKSSPAI